MVGLRFVPLGLCLNRFNRFKTVFFLAPIDAYEQTVVRMEDQELAVQISEWVQTAYRDWGYELVEVTSIRGGPRCFHHSKDPLGIWRWCGTRIGGPVDFAGVCNPSSFVAYVHSFFIIIKYIQ